MKERPILFSAPMVRAILDGRKSVTRRIVNWPPWVSEGDKLILAAQDPATGLAQYEDGLPVRRLVCPYGAPGDRLWVKETFGFTHAVRYDWKPSCGDHNQQHLRYATTPDGDVQRWRPSIFMPRWASRIDLEVADVRVERLQAITEDDARAEGITLPDLSQLDHFRGMDAVRAIPTVLPTARSQFRDLWDSLNAKRAPWESNPWVWVVAFKRVRP